MTLEEGYEFALKALVKTMETTSPNPKKIELVSVNFDMSEDIKGITTGFFLSAVNIDKSDLSDVLSEG